MKTGPLWMICLAMTAVAEPVRDLAPINQPLIALNKANLNGAGEDRIILEYADAVAGLYGQPVISQDLANAVTSALAGNRELSNETLTPFNQALLDALDAAAFRCRRTSSDLPRDVQFRNSVHRVYRALLDLDAGERQAQNVTAALLEAANRIWNGAPLIRPLTSR
jgi:hypothetical protein